MRISALTDFKRRNLLRKRGGTAGICSSPVKGAFFIQISGGTVMAAVITQAPKGTKDVLPSEVYRWHELERIIREQAEKYGFNELRTPIF